MTRAFTTVALTLGSLVLGAAAAAVQHPRIANARLTAQAAGAPFAQSFRTLVAAQAEPAWIGYAVPAADGERMLCCVTWAGGGSISGNIIPRDRASSGIAGCRLERDPPGSAIAPRTGHSSGPIELEAPDRLVVLFRVADRRVDRIRIFSEDCELDAGGRQVHWLENVRPADSIGLLESYAAGEGDVRRVADGAVSAIALHADPAADAALGRLIAPAQRPAVRKKVTFWLGHARGRAGFEMLKRALRDDPAIDVRKAAVFGLSQSREPDAVAALVAAARGHAEPKVRSEAIFWLGQKAGAKAARTIAERVHNDPDTEVKTRAVFALSQLPKEEGVPLLIQVARTNPNPAVKKQAMFWLGQSRDPRAIDFFADVLK